MRYPTTQEIVAKALFNLYGRTEPDAAISSMAAQELYDILVRLQQSHDLFFCHQRVNFSITAGKNNYSTADIFTVDNSVKMGEIYSIAIYNGSSMSELGPLSIEDYDAMSLQGSTGKPRYYALKYATELYTDRRIYIYPTPDKAYTGYLYYKRIYAPVNWTDDYSHPLLDEFGDYLVAKLTCSLCLLVNNADKYSAFDKISRDSLTSILSKSGNMFMQVTGGIGVPKW